MAEIFCDPLEPVRSSAQTAVDDNLAKEPEAFRTFAITGKGGDVTVPSNVHARFFNCNFDTFKAVDGNNIFYFQECTFNKPVEMTNVTFIAAGCVFVEGGTLTTCKAELVEHVIPVETTVAGVTTVITQGIPCRVQNTLTCTDYCHLKSKASIFEWLNEVSGFIDEITDVVTGFTKAILNLLNFSRFESMLDQFLNIPFGIINMFESCVANIVNMAFGIIDTLLAPIFNLLKSVRNLIAAINNLINTIKSIPGRIASLYKRCYAKIVGVKNMIARKIAFFAGLKSRIELQLCSRLASLESSIASVKDSSKMLVRNCESLFSPGEGTLEAMFKIDTSSLFELSRVGDIGTSNACVCKVTDNSIFKIFSAKSIESTATANEEAVIQADTDGDVELEDVESFTSDLASLISADNGATVTFTCVDLDAEISSNANSSSLFSAKNNASIFIENPLLATVLA
jgi:hypothetical protein